VTGHLGDAVSPSHDEVHHDVIDELVEALVRIAVEVLVADLLEQILVSDLGFHLALVIFVRILFALDKVDQAQSFVHHVEEHQHQREPVEAEACRSDVVFHLGVGVEQAAVQAYFDEVVHELVPLLQVLDLLEHLVIDDPAQPRYYFFLVGPRWLAAQLVLLF